MSEEMFPNDANPVFGPGKILRIAREEKNLRPEDVAYEIRLTSTQILALEEDDYSRMPEETYVRGYLRNYARLVGVAENDILMAFARLTRADTSAHANKIVTSDVEGDPKSKAFLIVGILVVLAAIAVGTFLLLNSADESLQMPTKAETVSKQDKVALNEVPVGSSTLNLNGQTTVTEDTSVSSESTVTHSAESIDAAETVSLNQPVALVKNRGNVNSQDTAAASKQKVVAQPGDVSTSTVEEVSDAGGVLIIHYTKDSWTDVRDATGKKLLYRTMKAGDNIALAGELPISLFFGFAQGVTVKFNGQNIDVTQYTRGVFARFSVGEKASR